LAGRAPLIRPSTCTDRLFILLAAVLTAVLSLLSGAADTAHAVTATASGTITAAAHTASSRTSPAAETRVGALTAAVATFVGAFADITAGQRRGNLSPGPAFVSATSVAAETVDAGATTVARDAAESCRNSFTADTPVTMADGTEKPIADVKVGDKVLATDPETGRTEARPVTALIRHTGRHTMVDITLADGSVLKWLFVLEVGHR